MQVYASWVKDKKQKAPSLLQSYTLCGGEAYINVEATWVVNDAIESENPRARCVEFERFGRETDWLENGSRMAKEWIMNGS